MIADEIAATKATGTPSPRCACCRAIATLTDDEQAELTAIFTGTVKDPSTGEPFVDHKVATWLSAKTERKVSRWTVRDCRQDHYGARRR